MSVRRTVFVLFTSVALLLSGCGNSDSPDPTTTTSTSTSTTSAPTTTVATPAVSVPSSTANAYLTDVSVESTASSDKVIFTFESVTPGYVIEYLSGPLTADGSGATVEVAGSETVQASFVIASGVKLTGGYKQTYTGPDRVTNAEAKLVKEVVKAGDYESHLTWGIGLDKKAAFTVSSEGNRVTVEFKS